MVSRQYTGHRSPICTIAIRRAVALHQYLITRRLRCSAASCLLSVPSRGTAHGISDTSAPVDLAETPFPRSKTRPSGFPARIAGKFRASAAHGEQSSQHPRDTGRKKSRPRSTAEIASDAGHPPTRTTRGCDNRHPSCSEKDPKEGILRSRASTQVQGTAGYHVSARTASGIAIRRKRGSSYRATSARVFCESRGRSEFGVPAGNGTRSVHGHDRGTAGLKRAGGAAAIRPTRLASLKLIRENDPSSRWWSVLMLYNSMQFAYRYTWNREIIVNSQKLVKRR